MNIYNPSLHETPREQPAVPSPLNRDSSVIEWLEASGRMLPREGAEATDLEPEEVDIAEMMDANDNNNSNYNDSQEGSFQAG